MKLYDQYRKAVEELGTIDIAWFTTFNFDPELVERFLLPALIDKPSSELKTAEDYEALNLELQEKNIKVWYDYRALNLSSRKQTTIPIVPFNPKEHYQALNTEAIFHPKVIFLKGKNGACVISGSANLSLSAWSSNCESVLFREIETIDNAKQVLDFFEYLGEDVSHLRKWAGRLNKEKSGWKFVYTNPKTNLLDELNTGSNKLTVWSPYFSKDLMKLARSFRDAGFKNLNLVPDKSNGKVRITPEQIDEIKKSKFIGLCVTNSNESEEQFHHAKVWLTDSVIGVGSWNFSNRATGVGIAVSERNIEAGILEKISSRDEEKLTASLHPYQLPLGTTIDELDEEWEGALSNYTFSCIIYADWETFRYKIDEHYQLSEYKVELPDNPLKKIALNRLNNYSFLDRMRRVLKDKSFRIYKGEELVFEGYLQEINCSKRQPYGYISLQDALLALIENPHKESTQKRVLYSLNNKDDLFGEDVSAELFEYRNTDSYYTMFVAMQKLCGLVAEAKDLEDLGYRKPGSLQNIKTLVQESLQACLKKFEKEKSDDELLYHWFLVNELNYCVKQFNFRVKENKKLVQSIGELEIELVEIRKKLKCEARDEKFMQLLVKEHYNVS